MTDNYCTDNYCTDRGTLANVRHGIPTDPHVFSYPGVRRVIPCSRIVCSRCGDSVKWHDALRITGNTKLLAAAWAADDPRGLGGVAPSDPGWRTYLCTCTSYLCTTTAAIAWADDLELRLEIPRTWACAGHEVRTLPTTIEGVEIPADADWPQLVCRTFRCAAPEDQPWYWVHWTGDVYAQLAGTPHPAAINLVVEDLLGSEDATLRAGALYFLWRPLDAPSTDILPQILLRDADTLRSQADPWRETDLYDVVACVVAYHIGRDRWPYEGAIRDALRAQVLAPGRAEGVGWLIARKEPKWFLDHYEMMLVGSPKARDKLAPWRHDAAQHQALFGG